MNRALTYIWLFFTVAGFLSCKDIFDADDIESVEKIPVILGSVYEGETPAVTLTWASSYLDDKIEYIHDATVEVRDDLGNSTAMVETERGKYVAVDSSFIGLAGRSYVLHVVTPDGREYESSSELISRGPEIDSLYAEVVHRTDYLTGVYGDLIPVDVKGLDIFVSIHRNTDSLCYFRYSANVVTEITYTLAPNSMFPIEVYEWESGALNSIYDVRFSYKSDMVQVVPEHKLGFTEFVYNSSLSSDAQTAPYTYAWIVSLKVYPVSRNVYQYYQSIAQQLGSNNQMFAPVPSQVRGNMTCLTDPDSKVVGVFEASSSTRVYKAFGWYNEERYLSKDLGSFPESVGRGSNRQTPPPFWVKF